MTLLESSNAQPSINLLTSLTLVTFWTSLRHKGSNPITSNHHNTILSCPIPMTHRPPSKLGCTIGKQINQIKMKLFSVMAPVWEYSSTRPIIVNFTSIIARSAIKVWGSKYPTTSGFSFKSKVALETWQQPYLIVKALRLLSLMSRITLPRTLIHLAWCPCLTPSLGWRLDLSTTSQQRLCYQGSNISRPSMKLMTQRCWISYSAQPPKLMQHHSETMLYKDKHCNQTPGSHSQVLTSGSWTMTLVTRLEQLVKNLHSTVTLVQILKRNFISQESIAMLIPNFLYLKTWHNSQLNFG